MKLIIVLLGLGLTAGVSAAEEKYSEFESHNFDGPGGVKLPYRLLKPEGAQPGKKYPLVLCLHGYGDRGTDNHAQLRYFAPEFLKAGVRKKLPCFVVAPQANGSWIQHAVFDKSIPLTAKPTAALTAAVEIVHSVVKSHPVDANRVYVMGYSNGACGVWEILEREPARGRRRRDGWGGRSGAGRHGTARTLWVFHGSKDTTIPIARMHEMIDALRHVGGKPTYTIIADARMRAPLEKGLRSRMCCRGCWPGARQAGSSVKKDRRAESEAADEPPEVVLSWKKPAASGPMPPHEFD